MQPAKAIGRPKRKILLGGPGTKSSLAIRNAIIADRLKIIGELKELAFHSKNEKTKLEALNTLLDKILPNARENSDFAPNRGITVKLIPGGYIPPTRINGTPVGGNPRPPQIQSARLASKGKENVYSYHASNQPGDAN